MNKITRRKWLWRARARIRSLCFLYQLSTFNTSKLVSVKKWEKRVANEFWYTFDSFISYLRSTTIYTCMESNLCTTGENSKFVINQRRTILSRGETKQWFSNRIVVQFYRSDFLPLYFSSLSEGDVWPIFRGGVWRWFIYKNDENRNKLVWLRDRLVFVKELGLTRLSFWAKKHLDLKLARRGSIH